MPVLLDERAARNRAGCNEARTQCEKSGAQGRHCSGDGGDGHGGSGPRSECRVLELRLRPTSVHRRPMDFPRVVRVGTRESFGQAAGEAFAQSSVRRAHSARLRDNGASSRGADAASLAFRAGPALVVASSRTALARGDRLNAGAVASHVARGLCVSAGANAQQFAMLGIFSKNATFKQLKVCVPAQKASHTRSRADPRLALRRRPATATHSSIRRRAHGRS
jgi:hypothetical protein